MNGLPMADVVPALLPTGAADRLSTLVDRHYERLYRLARRLAPSADEARDLVQDTFLKSARSPAATSGGKRASAGGTTRRSGDRQRPPAMPKRHWLPARPSGVRSTRSRRAGAPSS